MQEIISAVTNLPVLVQGAAGSGIFWLVLLVFSKTSKWLFVHGSLITTKTREDILEDRVGFLTGALSKDVNVTSLMVVGV
ncbi:hypothetical protein, partial [Vibrio parahaemolyticus]